MLDIAPDDPVWQTVRSVLIDGDEYWINDHLILALNYGNCIMEGKHPQASETDWRLISYIHERENYGYDQATCYELYRRLDSERLLLFWELENS
jgi:hypothetical protein